MYKTGNCIDGLIFDMVKFYHKIILKGIDEEYTFVCPGRCVVTSTEKQRLVQAAGTAFVFVASEPRGRKRSFSQVEPLRDCCVKA